MLKLEVKNGLIELGCTLLNDETLNKNVGEFLRKKREELKLTQGQVATELGYSSPQFISNIERGLCAPPMKSLKKIAKIYQLQNSELIQLILKEQERLLVSALDS